MFPPPHMQFSMPMQFPGTSICSFCLSFLPPLLHRRSPYLCLSYDMNQGGPPMGMPMPGHPPHMQQYPPHMAMPGMPGRGPLPGELLLIVITDYLIIHDL